MNYVTGSRRRAVKRAGKKIRAPANQLMDEILKKQPVVNLDRSFVSNYLRTQLNENTLALSLNETSQSVTEADSSIIFVNEGEATPKTKKIVAKNAIIAKLSTRVKNLSIHVKALQRKLLEAGNVEQQPPIEIDASENIQTEEEIDKQLEEWCEKQLAEWKNNNELSQICREFIDYLNDM